MTLTSVTPKTIRTVSLTIQTFCENFMTIGQKLRPKEHPQQKVSTNTHTQTYKHDWSTYLPILKESPSNEPSQLLEVNVTISIQSVARPVEGAKCRTKIKLGSLNLLPPLSASRFYVDYSTFGKTAAGYDLLSGSDPLRVKDGLNLCIRAYLLR